MFFFLCAFLQAEVYFSETFPQISLLGTKWIKSNDRSYSGNWALEKRLEDLVNSGINGLVTKTDSAASGISAVANFVPKNTTDFVFQFEHKVQAHPFVCGGSYIRLLNEDFSPYTFHPHTSFVIMFGPDKCDQTNQIQFSFKTINTLSNEWVEHKLKKVILPYHDNITHLYTLIIHPDDKFTIKIDGIVRLHASLKDAGLFEPPFEPPLIIPDPNEKKPATWVDNELMLDPNDFKPADWDENAPKTIPDPNATIPSDWKVDEPWEVPNPAAIQPALWNEEEDGKWEPPVIDNPYCVDHGCGPWSPKLVPNPAYKGKWTQKQIKNPAYIGVWKPKDIPNPYHYVPENIHTISKITGVGIEIFSVKSQQWFGNIYLGDSAKEAEDFAKTTFVPNNKEEIVKDYYNKVKEDRPAEKEL